MISGLHVDSQGAMYGRYMFCDFGWPHQVERKMETTICVVMFMPQGFTLAVEPSEMKFCF